MKNQKHVLIVDDEIYSRILLNEMLKSLNIKISQVQNGEDAINFISNNNDINLILMDKRMPFMNGIEATIAIRKMGINIPIIMQTASAYDDDKINSLNSGCNEYISKPIRYNDILKLVKKYI